MIISHRYKFIFIKTIKTAGTSVEWALGDMCGPEDVITPNFADDDRRAEMGLRTEQNFCPSFRQYSLRDWVITLRRRKRKRFYHHMSAAEIKLLVGDPIWNSYFKFCFERNPWDRTVSLYWWRERGKFNRTLSEFIASGEPRDLTKRGVNLYSIDGKVAVDRVCKYEYLDEELKYLEERLGLPGPLVLPKAKSQYRLDRRHYRDVLSPHERELISEMSKKEIELYGYQY